MNTFIFQSLPDRFDLRKKLIEGNADTWYATRYRNEMKLHDLVYFWMGGDERSRGIYGWGRIIREPYIREDWDSYGVDVEYTVRFNKLISYSHLKKDGELKNMLIIRAPQATNFLVDESQNKKLIKLIRDLNEKEPQLT